ncbi:MAG: CsgG/HfaB family protein [Planctomycetota bacterium]|jgi:hypothetical protein
MKTFYTTLIVGVLFCTSLFAAQDKDVVVREVIGRGATKDQAVKNALYTAVGQARGVEVDSERYNLGFHESGVGLDADDTGEGRSTRIQFDSIAVGTQGNVYTTKIGGAVKTYEVLEEQKTEDGYEVKVRVTIIDYAPRDDSHRPKIGLMHARTLQPTYVFLDNQVPGAVVSAMFTQKLAMALTQTNKFAVLDRESMAEFARERSLLLSNDAPLEERAKLAEMLGSDYLLVGTISQAKLERKAKRLSAANYTVTEHKARVVFNYRLVSGYSRQIVQAGVVEKYLENEEIRAIADEQSSAEWDPAQIREAIFAIVANEVVEKIIDRLYPVKVVSVQPNGQIIVNQGGDRIEPGTVFEIYKQGEELFDPDTKESLGKVETLVATIKITRVAQKMSFAEVVSGEALKVTKGLLCRPKKKETKAFKKIGTESEVEKLPNRGVKLPFDK